ncbi:MAG: hypothetical protein ACE5F1_19545, partial [Planctomycetota bacterium]
GTPRRRERMRREEKEKRQGAKEPRNAKKKEGKGSFVSVSELTRDGRSRSLLLLLFFLLFLAFLGSLALSSSWRPLLLAFLGSLAPWRFLPLGALSS